MQKVGFLLFLLGAGGMDSPNMAVPAILVLSGLTFLLVEALRKMRDSKEYSRKQGIKDNAAA